MAHGEYMITAGHGIVDEAAIAMSNINNPTLRVRHSELEHADDQSYYRRMCPLCGFGFLLIHRDGNTMELLAIDHCILCAQGFEYIDIAELNGM